jgi:glycosyltransferase involved in cell wall biosynthesis
MHAALRITILLPLSGGRPCGGFKVAYEYANFLAAQGHAVTVVHSVNPLKDRPLRAFPWRRRAGLLRKFLTQAWNQGYRPDAWFSVRQDVKLTWHLSLAPRNIPDGDVVIATAWETAEWAASYGPRKGHKFYLIQHLETWAAAEERVLATWTAPLHKIVIARWLAKKAAELGERCVLIENGLDFSRFSLTTPVRDRDPNELLMLFHIQDWKGTADGLAAIAIAQNQVPGLRLTLFSIYPRPENLPKEIEFHHQPSPDLLKQLYNRAAIFIAPSWSEGWALPGAEAQMCGATLVATDIPGHDAYAHHDITALLSPAQNPEALARNIVELATNSELRIRLAEAGHTNIQQFTWQRAGSALEAELLRVVEHPLTAAVG